jgi:TolA-binding protein
MNRRITFVPLICVGLCACGTTAQRGTLADLDAVPADLDDVYVQGSLEQAAESYRRYLDETPKSARTPEAMRRLADLQIEQAYGVIGNGDVVEMAAPESGTATHRITAEGNGAAPAQPAESDEAFEKRTTERYKLLSSTVELEAPIPGGEDIPVPAGPREAIKTYWTILESYPNYERNDQVLYQLSRAYDEVGEPDKAMEVMDRLVKEFPYSKYLDEVYFRRGEYYFVRKKYLDAEDAYGAVVKIGTTSSYYELALYKLGWSLYKQELYEEALRSYLAMLDYRLSIGYDFDQEHDEDDELRLADTFRVISLSFSNLGGPEVVDEYFAKHGQRSFADKIYGNLAEFYFGKLRYEDAASVYKSFIKLNPYHRVSPYFSMRVVEIYDKAGFPKLVVAAKKEFAATYALNAEYWNYTNVEDAPEVVGFLKQNLTDLASHYHALYQEESLGDDKPANFKEAQHWYREFLASFPQDTESPQINYQLANLLLENGNFGDAAREYERTAYDYPTHEQAAAAGYAAIYAYREQLKVATGAQQLEVKQATVSSSLRFADAFPDHKEAPVVLGKAADDLYEMKNLAGAIEAAHKLIARYPGADRSLIRSAWAVIANSSLDIAEYQNAEQAYSRVLELTDPDDETRQNIVDGLAASIYKQGEQANLLEDYRAAAAHFLRIKDVAPTSSIRIGAEYDAATALMKVKDWAQASAVLEDFRKSHPDDKLAPEATKQLAYIYHEAGQTERSAAEYERIAAEADDPEARREALLTAGGLYDDAGNVAETLRVYERYVSAYPRPLDVAMETRNRIAELYKSRQDLKRYEEELNAMVAADRDAGEDRTDRSRYLAAQAALVLAEKTFDSFKELALVQPFEESLAEKQKRMDVAMQAFQGLIDYQVADVTAAATYYIAEIYYEFSQALANSERPTGLSNAEKDAYEMAIEEEAYPFEERAIEIHEQNHELLAGGVYNSWVQQSMDRLAVLMPGRYAKNEISSGYLGSIDSYAYRMPIAPPVPVDGEEDGGKLQSRDQAESPPQAVQVANRSAEHPQK